MGRRQGRAPPRGDQHGVGRVRQPGRARLHQDQVGREGGRGVNQPRQTGTN